MLTVTIILFAGILSGFFVKKLIDTGSLPDKVVTALIVFLLFVMGYSIGSNRIMAIRLITAGKNALLISLATVIVSIVISFPVYRYFFRDEDEA